MSRALATLLLSLTLCNSALAVGCAPGLKCEIASGRALQNS